jgi:cytochrome b
MNNETNIRVWDPLVRLFHWGLVSAFALAYLSEDDWMNLHVYAGYTVLGLLGFRLVWGFVGPRYARFSDFVRPPWEVVSYLKGLFALRAKRFLGHNPAGGAMIVLLLLSLVLTTLTGLGAYGAEGYGPLAAWAAGLVGLGKEALEEVHEFAANFTLFLIVVHIAGVLFGSLLHKENLVRAMITGRKPN